MPSTAAARAAEAPGWQAWLPLLPLLALVLLVFHETFGAMVGIWVRSETFAHAFLVPPITLWLAWRMRGTLRGLPVRPALWWLLPMAGACLLWQIGRLTGAAAATQFAVVSLLVFSVPLVLGRAVGRQLAFPLLFLYFCVPFGDFLVEPMMEGTADFTVLALRLSGIPVYREGLQFVIPSGNWSVVEACSGVRYLIASFMVGTLFASLNYRSRWRQVLFVALSLLVPVVANWLRAYLIVMLGHHSGNTLAVGADHLIYGWVFFGVVILIMFTIGARFSEVGPMAAQMGSAQPVPAATAREGAGAGGRASTRPALAASALAALIVLGTQALSMRLEPTEGGGAPPRLTLPAQLPGGWAASDEALTPWQPRYQNPSAVAAHTYRRGALAIGAWVALYRDQGFERKLITSTNVLVPQRSIDWLPVPQAPMVLRAAGGDAQPQHLRATLLRTPADPKVSPRQRLLVLQVYRVGGRFVSEDARVRLQVALRRLLGHDDDSAVLMFFAEADDADQGADAAAQLQHFVQEHLAAFGAAVDAASRRP